MKFILSVILILAVTTTSYGQAKKREKVKRKFRNAEKISGSTEEPVFLRGEVYDWNKMPLAGANITVDGTRKGVHTNEAGEFFLKNLSAGKVSIRVSFVGYQTNTIDVHVREGENYKKIMLRTEKIHLPPVIVNSQKREQQILDVPMAVSSISNAVIENNNITALGQLSEFVPGLMIREQGANRPSFVIRGINSDEVSPSAQPRVSIYMNSIPINRASSASVELFDMERVEALKGPQNTLFGRGAQAGAIHFISKKPVNTLNGYVSAGGGNFAQREVKGMINSPVLEDMLFIRAAGIYRAHNGFVDNTFGGSLNGKNTIAGRLSARFIPDYFHKLDLVINYQKDDYPGIAFMSDTLPNTNGEIGIFSGTASLEQGKQLGTAKDFFDAALNYKLFFNEHDYVSTITSYRKSNSSARWDGDGTAARAIDMSENSSAKQFYQELRLNFAQNSRLNGSLGGSYWWEEAEQTYWFSPNEQHAVHLFLDPTQLVTENGQPVPLAALPPEFGQLAGLPLPADHEEENYNTATNRALEGFIDGTYQFNKNIFISAGVRVIYDMFKLGNEAIFLKGTDSSLGYITRNYPNFLFKPSEMQEISENTFSVTGRAGIQYKFHTYGNVFANYSRGRRPTVLQFTSTGEPEILEPEILDNYDAGFKATFYERLYVDLVGFYQNYKNFQTRAWVADPESGEFNYKVEDGGKATSFGAELNVNMAIAEQLDIFANYAWLHSSFDSTDVDGQIQEYAGNRFSLAPEHSFTVGFNSEVYIAPEMRIFATPSYSFKSHMFFEDANTPGLEQDAYGLLNATLGIELEEYSLKLTLYGTNILDEQYITSAGNTGSLFGVPTYVPGAPRMYGAKLKWTFNPERRKTLKRKSPAFFRGRGEPGEPGDL